MITSFLAFSVFSFWISLVLSFFQSCYFLWSKYIFLFKLLSSDLIFLIFSFNSLIVTLCFLLNNINSFNSLSLFLNSNNCCCNSFILFINFWDILFMSSLDLVDFNFSTSTSLCFLTLSISSNNSLIFLLYCWSNSFLILYCIILYWFNWVFYSSWLLSCAFCN